MIVTEILMQEHKIILETISQLEPHLKEQQPDSFTRLSEFITFVREVVDKFHHAKEEELYFVWMKKYNPGLEQGPLSCMLGEHDQGRSLISNADQAVQAQDFESARKSILEFNRLLDEHINKENNVLYHMAEQIDSVQNCGDKEMLEAFGEVTAKLPEIADRYGITVGAVPEIL